MTFIALETARCRCTHGGTMRMEHSQDWVTIDGTPVLVKGDLDHRPVIGCGAGAEPVGVVRCRTIATVDDRPSHSAFVTIDGKGVVLSTANGATDYSSVNLSPWSMASPGQEWIEIVEG